jgi:hypothetical protein
VFDDAAESIDGSQCSPEASGVIALFELVRLARAAVPEAAPTLAWRVRDYGMRTTVQPRVPSLVPWINVRQTEVTAVGLNEQSSNHARSSSIAIRGGVG